jgi:hypothetical protein
MGLAQHPMSQILQEYGDMLDLQAEFKKSFNSKNQKHYKCYFDLEKLNQSLMDREVW